MYFADIKLKVKVRAGWFENWKFQLLEKIALSYNPNSQCINKLYSKYKVLSYLLAVSQAAELSKKFESRSGRSGQII